MRHLLMTVCLFLAFSVIAIAQKKPSDAGWYNLTQTSFVIGEENESSAAKANMVPSVVMINGYRMNKHVSLGLGIGMTSFTYLAFPVFADLRITLIDNNLSPVLALKGGYSIANNTKKIFPKDYYYGEFKNSGGGMFNPEFGFKVMMTERLDFLLTIGFYYQHLKSVIHIYPDTPNYSKHDRISDINRLSFTIGFCFH